MGEQKMGKQKMIEGKLRLFVSACEPSSNLHLSKLLGLLFARFEKLEVCGIFDEALKEQYPTEPPLWSLKDFAVMGIFDVLKKIFFYKNAIALSSELAASCDVALLMDSSSFNLPIAKNLKKSNLKKSGAPTKVVYYILPQVWAWKPWRAREIERVCDVLCGILPFEGVMYKNAVREGRFHYVGHPLLDEIREFKSVQNLDSENDHSPGWACGGASNEVSSVACDITSDVAPTIMPNAASNATPALALLPGSRRSEIKRIFPTFAAAAKMLAEQHAQQFPNKAPLRKILVVPTHLSKLSNKELRAWYGDDMEGFELSFDANKTLLESGFAFVCSGTATLQAVLIGTPLVLGYKSRAIEVMILRQFVRLSHIGLANIFYTALKSGSPKAKSTTDSEVFEIHTELIQDRLTTANLIAAYHEANNPHWREAFEHKVGEIRAYLGHGSAQKTSELLAQLLMENPKV